VIAPGELREESELGVMAVERAQAGPLVAGAIEGEKGGVVPVHEFLERMIGTARGETQPRGPLAFRSLQRRAHRLEDEQMRGVPVFPAASVGNDQIAPAEVGAQLDGEVRHADFGGEDLVSLALGIDMPQEDQFVHGEDVAGPLHLLGPDPPERLAGMASARTSLALGEADDPDIRTVLLHLADQPRAEDLVVGMGHDDGDRGDPPEAAGAEARLRVLEGAETAQHPAEPFPVKDRISEPLADFPEDLHDCEPHRISRNPTPVPGAVQQNIPGRIPRPAPA
jgi:hypothetical protein